MKNRPIAVFLQTIGISGINEQATARRILEEHGFTRPGRVNMATTKEVAARDLLENRLAFHCSSYSCFAALQKSVGGSKGRRLLLVERDACEVCQGSADRMALNELGQAMAGSGLARVVVLGGSSRKTSRIRELTPAAIEWRFVDGLKRINSKEAASDLDWGDVIVIWATTPLLHSVSNHFAKGPRTITAPTTGIAALAKEVTKYATRQRR